MIDIKYFDTVTSTNDIAKQLAANGASEGTVIIAAHQSAGRGRMGRSFMSPVGTGLYMSIVLRPSIPAESALLITTAAAVSVAKAIEKHSGKDAKIKWVNDVFVSGKKVCGILTEGMFLPSGSFDYAILGIGVNLLPPKDGFGELENIAGAVFDGEFDKAAFTNDILNFFFEYYQNLSKKPHFDEYAKRDMLCGKEVQVLRAGDVVCSATVCGIDENFSLIMKHDGKKETLSTGEVSAKEKPV